MIILYHFIHPFLEGEGVLPLLLDSKLEDGGLSSPFTTVPLSLQTLVPNRALGT